MTWQGPPGQVPTPHPQPQPFRPAPSGPAGRAQGYPQQAYPQPGYPQQGYPQPGYPQQGFALPGQPRPGQPRPGQNRPGQNQPAPPHQQPNPSGPTQQFGSGLVRPDEVYGIAKPLNQSYGVRREPSGSGLLLAGGLFLLVLGFIVPASLLYLAFGTIPECLPGAASGSTCSVASGSQWGLVVPIIAAVLTIGFAGRVIANAGARRRPLRAAIHLILGAAVLAISVDQVTSHLGIAYFSW